MDDCIFCKIVKGELPCYKIYEDEDTLAFLDISNDIPGHTLVIPKAHCKNILDCPPEVLQNLALTVQKVANHYVNKCGFDGVNVLNANNAEAEQSVFHLHFHILPRKDGDGFKTFPQYPNCGLELKSICERLKLK